MRQRTEHSNEGKLDSLCRCWPSSVLTAKRWAGCARANVENCDRPPCSQGYRRSFLCHKSGEKSPRGTILLRSPPAKPDDTFNQSYLKQIYLTGIVQCTVESDFVLRNSTPTTREVWSKRAQRWPVLRCLSLVSVSE